MHHIEGKCHCGNIHVALELSAAPGDYAPRACDCDFCRKHGASYLSDPHGTLRIDVADARLLGRYRQGSGMAECLLCRECGVLVGVTYREEGRLYAAVNTRVLEGGVGFGEGKSVSPKLLAGDEKVRRWKELWFANVTLVADGA